MNLEELKGLKYYVAYAFVLLAFFFYSGITGWKWLNMTKTTKERSGTTHHGGRGYIYHK